MTFFLFLPLFQFFPSKVFFSHSHTSAVYSFKIFSCNIIGCQIQSQLKYTQHFSLYCTHSRQQSFSYLYLLRLHKFMQTVITPKTLAKIIKVILVKLHQLGDKSSIKGKGPRMCSQSIIAKWVHITHKLQWHFTSKNPTQHWVKQEFALPLKASQLVQIQYAYWLSCLPKDTTNMWTVHVYIFKPAADRHKEPPTPAQQTCTPDSSRCCYQLQSFPFLFPVLSTTPPCNRTALAEIFSLPANRISRKRDKKGQDASVNTLSQNASQRLLLQDLHKLSQLIAMN